MRGCCEIYDVSVAEDELSRLIGMVEAGKGLYAGLDRHCGGQDFFEETDDGRFSIATDEDMRCVFTYRSGHRVRCYLHSVALRLKLDPFQAKPQACAIWPLALSDGPRPVLGLQKDAFLFPCNRRRQGQRTLDEGIDQIIRGAFGQEFLDQLKAAASAEQRH